MIDDHPADLDERDERFESLLAAVTEGGTFGHREHVRLTWLAVRAFGIRVAEDLVCRGIQRTARYEGAPQKYHATMSKAWVALVGHHAAEAEDADFEEFLDRNPPLRDKRLLMRFYRPATLASSAARRTWVEPDREPFPWTVTAR